MVKFRINTLLIDPLLTIVVIEAVESRATKTETGGYLFGSVAPIAVVACRSNEITAWDMQARPASVEQLRRDIPGLDAELSAQSLRRRIPESC